MGRLIVLVVLALVLPLGVGCAGRPDVMPRDAFWSNLGGLCGRAFPGRVVIDTTKSPTFRDKPLALYVARCTADEIVMPLLIEDKVWATLTLTRSEGSLTLEHTHEPEAGGTNPPSGYGGGTRGPGTDIAQDFYADEFTALLSEGASDTVWTIELRPGAVLSYRLRREGSDRRFHAVFDLSRGRPAPTLAPLGR
jgi:hypothetical protein